MSTETDSTDNGNPEVADVAEVAPTDSTDNANPEVVDVAGAPEHGDEDVEREVERNARKLREGVVVSTKMDKTAVIAVVDRVRHPKYAKYMQRTKKLYAHDEANEANVGDRVRVMETRPLSKLKRWRVVEVLERAK